MQKKVTVKVEFEFYPSEYDSEYGGNLNNLDDESLTDQTRQMVDELLSQNLDTGMWSHVDEIVVTSSN